MYDNSIEASAEGTVPDPKLVLEMQTGRLAWPKPDRLDDLQHTPNWAKPLLGAALP